MPTSPSMSSSESISNPENYKRSHVPSPFITSVVASSSNIGVSNSGINSDGVFGSVRFPETSKPKYVKPNPANPRIYDRDFYDRFGHSPDTQSPIHVDDMEPSECDEAKVVDTTVPKIKPETASGSVTKAEFEEAIRSLPPLATHLNYIRTNDPSFNFNSMAFTITEFHEIRERERLAEKLALEKKLGIDTSAETASTDSAMADESKTEKKFDRLAAFSQKLSPKAQGKQREILSPASRYWMSSGGCLTSHHIETLKLIEEVRKIPGVIKLSPKAQGKQREIPPSQPRDYSESALSKGTLFAFRINEIETMKRFKPSLANYLSRRENNSDGDVEVKGSKEFHRPGRGNDLSRGQRNHDREGRRPRSVERENQMFVGYACDSTARGIDLAILSSTPYASSASRNFSSNNFSKGTKKGRRGIPIQRYKHPPLPVSPTESLVSPSPSSSSLSSETGSSPSSLGSSFVSIGSLESLQSLHSSSFSNSVLSPGLTTLFDPTSPNSMLPQSLTSISSSRSTDYTGRSFLDLSSSSEDESENDPFLYHQLYSRRRRKLRSSLPIHLHTSRRSHHQHDHDRRRLSEPATKKSCQSPNHLNPCFCIPSDSSGEQTNSILGDLLDSSPMPPSDPFPTSSHSSTSSLSRRPRTRRKVRLRPSRPLPTQWGMKIYAYRPRFSGAIVEDLDTQIRDRNENDKGVYRPNTKTTFAWSDVAQILEEYDLIDEENENRRRHRFYQYSGSSDDVDNITDPIIPLPSSTPKHPGSPEEWANTVIIDASLDLDLAPSLIRDPSEFDTAVENIQRKKTQHYSKQQRNSWP